MKYQGIGSKTYNAYTCMCTTRTTIRNYRVMNLRDKVMM